MKIKEGRFLLEKDFCLLFEYCQDAELFKNVTLFCEKYKKLTGESCYPVADYCGKRVASVTLAGDSSLSEEEYKIKIGKKGVFIAYGTPVGAFRALTTLSQLVRENGKALPFLEIHDFPDVKRRGFMLDISRGRVPKIDEIFRLVDLLSELKYNELQLYLENLAFEYAAYPEYSKDIDALTPFDVMRLSAYCRERYIELVPNQNSFGHLYNWVQKPELRELELFDNDFCINPLDPRSIELLNNIYDSLLPCFDSELFNVGCDEVGGLAESEKTKAECERLGGEVEVYMNHLMRLQKMLSERGKRMMFWADVIFNHPEKIPMLSKDMIPLIWGYEADTDFEKPGKILAETGMDFYFCPGTATWASVVGDNDKAQKNILHAAQSCKKHGGTGVLLTDWGDGGHCQFFVISHIAVAYCGGVCWNVKASELSSATEFVDSAVYKMKQGSLCELLLEAGRVIPKSGNCTDSFLSILVPFDSYNLCNTTPYERLFSAKAEYADIAERARCITLGCEDAACLVDEFCCNLEINQILVDLLAFKYEKKDGGKVKNLKKRLTAIERRVSEVKVMYERLWANRNLLTGKEIFWNYITKNIADIKNFCKEDMK